jgi:hypothetical protein
MDRIIGHGVGDLVQIDLFAGWRAAGGEDKKEGKHWEDSMAHRRISFGGEV